MLKSIPGTLRYCYDKDNLLNRRNRPLAKSDVKAVFRKILQPTRFKLSELTDEPVIGELLDRIITLSSKWRRYIDRKATFYNGQGSVDHISVHAFLLCHIRRCLPSNCFLEKSNANAFKLYILFYSNFVPTHLRYFISMPIDGRISISSLCRRFKAPQGLQSSGCLRVYYYLLVVLLFTHLVPALLQSVFRCVYCHKRRGAIRYYSFEKWKAIQTVQKDDFISQGILKECPAKLIKEHSLPVCRSCLVLKPSGKLRLISIPTTFNTRFKQAGGLVEFIRILHDQVPFTFRPSLPNVSLSFKALNNFRCLFPTNQTIYAVIIVLRDMIRLSFFHFRQSTSQGHRSQGNISSPSSPISLITTSSGYENCLYFKEIQCPSPHLGGRCYQQTKGIPQGSCISTDLSNLFLAFIDRRSSLAGYFWDAEKRTSSNTNAPEAAILRFHDDYLLVATSKERLLDIRSGLIDNLNSFGLKSNTSKENIVTDGVGLEYVEWLGLEITPRLNLLFPKVTTDKLVFERFGGYPLSWKKCLFRIKSFLQTSLLIKLVIKQADFKSNSSLAEENARRIGSQFGYILLTYIWSCPERQKFLTSFKHCRYLAKIVLCRLAMIFKDTPLLSLARENLIQVLRRRRNNFKTLLRCVYRPWIVLSIIRENTSCKKILSQYSNSIRTRNHVPSGDE
ncbi:unnamed protein product [Rodentolepis nana]|uniref:Telomerase reverse transcriptase n=1 Tax=Rodentolepis nana TaxID=102285 RepID=A0A0R3TXC2_RODNA|nr:unnamed protein product [Rodentolepis nana]